MSTVYYKAVRLDGGSFREPSFAWATEPGGVTRHPHWRSGVRSGSDASTYLSVATVPTDCTGMQWPCRLLVVEPIGPTWVPDATGLPNKVAGRRWRTVRELPAHEALGQQGEHVAALIDRIRSLTVHELRTLDAAGAAAQAAARVAARDAAQAAAWDAARDAAWDAARDAAWDAAQAAAWDAARAAAWDAARALVIHDLIGDTFTQAHYDLLTVPWRQAIGPIHPDDEELT